MEVQYREQRSEAHQTTNTRLLCDKTERKEDAIGARCAAVKHKPRISGGGDGHVEEWSRAMSKQSIVLRSQHATNRVDGLPRRLILDKPSASCDGFTFSFSPSSTMLVAPSSSARLERKQYAEKGSKDPGIKIRCLCLLYQTIILASFEQESGNNPPFSPNQ